MLKISNLFTAKEETQILKGLSISLEKEKTYILLGPNGSGKSSLAKVIAGNPTFETTKGTMVYQNEDLQKLSVTERALKRIFLAHQSPLEINGLNIFSYLHLIHNKHQEKEMSVRDFDKLLNENLSLLRIPIETKNRSFNGNFSGGERKKMEVLQMLLLKPKLVILDEIDSGVDVDSLRTILQVLTEYKRTNLATMLFITHNIDLAKKILADEIFVMRNGEIVKKAELLKEKNDLLSQIDKEGYESI